MQEARLEDERRHRQRGLCGGQVQGRKGDQVPKRLELTRSLPLGGQPVTEGPLVERGVVEAEAREPERRAGGSGTPARRQMAVAGERGSEVKRGGQRRSPQPLDSPSGGEHRDRQAPLEDRRRIAAQPREQRPVGGTAAQEDVLPVVEHHPVAFERIRRAPEPRANLDQRRLRARVRAGEGRRDAGQASAHDGDAHLAHVPTPARLRAATHAFSQAGRETRRRSTSPGSRSIWVRILR